MTPERIDELWVMRDDVHGLHVVEWIEMLTEIERLQTAIRRSCSRSSPSGDGPGSAPNPEAREGLTPGT